MKVAVLIVAKRQNHKKEKGKTIRIFAKYMKIIHKLGGKSPVKPRVRPPNRVLR